MFLTLRLHLYELIEELLVLAARDVESVSALNDEALIRDGDHIEIVLVVSVVDLLEHVEALRLRIIIFGCCECLPDGLLLCDAAIEQLEALLAIQLHGDEVTLH